jgi:hypothetical protein
VYVIETLGMLLLPVEGDHKAAVSTRASNKGFSVRGITSFAEILSGKAKSSACCK